MKEMEGIDWDMRYKDVKECSFSLWGKRVEGIRYNISQNSLKSGDKRELLEKLGNVLINESKKHE